MPEVFLSVGSNIERERYTPLGIAILVQRYGEIRRSSLYESIAVGCEGDPYFNAVVSFSTDETPSEVVAALREVEDACGRRRGGPRYAARTMDIDLLLYDDLICQQNGLRLPRDEILDFAFVLKPLAELAGELRHPVKRQTYAALWEAFDASEQPLWQSEFDLDAAIAALPANVSG